ncbi:hypothetical protein BJ742DRAFT_858025 [Cladochytrium replicatum]|nr:hypothetical protein BJ742DRAFT_858025 [Cladochytrium replicatum]
MGTLLQLNHNIINPLSNPKGVRLECELCGKPAYIQCKECRVTYYCDRDHESTDYRGIHSKICQLLISLRTPVTILGSEEERGFRDKQTRERQVSCVDACDHLLKNSVSIQVHLLELTKTEAHKKLFEGQYDLAIPAALQALRFSMDVYGQDSIELVPSYLLLGEASIGLKQYGQAEDYLSLAKWAVLKAEHCDHAIRSQLHRNLGMLYISQGNVGEALKQLSNDIYYSSLAKDPEHIMVTGGYFQLGGIFEKQKQYEVASAIFDKIVGIWRATLKDGSETLDEAQQAEAAQMLNAIYTYRVTHGSTQTGPAEVRFVLAQLYHSVHQNEKAKECATSALEVYESALGREHSITIEVRDFLKNLLGEGGISSLPPRSNRRGSMGNLL